MNLLPSIPGIDNLELIGQGARSAVYRGLRQGRLVAVKVPRPGSDLVQSARDYRREASLVQASKAAGIPRVYEVGASPDNPYLISEFVDGRTLASRLRQGPLSASESQRLAIDLATVLQAVHGQALIHRDLKPSNVMIGPDGSARLIDFGLATRVLVNQEASEVTGTFSYSAPEQTGILKHPLDGRADLYSLGVVLYECLAGRLPFLETDPAELMRQHAVSRPPRLSELAPQASPLLLEAVERLLSKDPSGRFPSAAALLSYLGAPKPKQVSVQELFGRHSQSQALQTDWQQTLTQGGRLLAITGELGIGKSALAQELLNSGPVASSQAFTLQAKCDSGLAPFGLLHNLINQVLSGLNSEQRARLTPYLVAAAGEKTALIAQFSPQLAQLFPHFSNPIEGNHIQALSDFLLALAANHPALIVIEDLQWIDSSSLDVLSKVSQNLQASRCLILITSRQELPQELQIAAEQVHALSRLSHSETAMLLEHLLGGQPAPELCDQLHSLTNGNPFALKENLLAALESGLLLPHWGGWRLHGEGLAELELRGDGLDAVVRRLDHLTAAQRQALQLAALLGLRFSTPTWIGLLEQHDGNDLLAESTRLQILEMLTPKIYRFCHDRIREALVAEMETDLAKSFHRRIGQYLADQQSQDIFAIAEHYWAAWSGGPDAELHQSSLEAGLLAVTQHANREAYSYFERAQNCVPNGQSPLPKYQEAAGDACYHTARFSQALDCLNQAVQQYSESLDRARLYSKIAMIQLVDVDTVGAWPSVAAGLQQLGLARSTGSLSQAAFILKNLGTLSSVPDQTAAPSPRARLGGRPAAPSRCLHLSQRRSLQHRHRVIGARPDSGPNTWPLSRHGFPLQPAGHLLGRTRLQGESAGPDPRHRPNLRQPKRSQQPGPMRLLPIGHSKGLRGRISGRSSGRAVPAPTRLLDDHL